MRLRAPLLAACILLVAAGPALGVTRYTVRWGDTLTAIAHNHGVGVWRLARRNHIRVHGILRAGSVLVIPGSRRHVHVRRVATYTVRPGDTLSGIAARFGTSLGGLARLNHRAPYATLVIGTRLRVPSAGRRSHHSARRRHHGGARPHFRGRYRVVPGDTLSGLAARFRTTIGRLARANYMGVNSLLISGRVIAIPLHGAWRHPRSRSGSSAGVPGLLDFWASHYGVSRGLVRAVAWQESGFHTNIVSPAGARGVMQVMPETWVFTEQVLIGEYVPHTASGNIRIGVAYLHSLLDAFGGDTRLAVASYYQGAASVMRDGVQVGTRRYVRDVLALSRRM
jgi:LysM repeat protein